MSFLSFYPEYFEPNDIRVTSIFFSPNPVLHKVKILPRQIHDSPIKRLRWKQKLPKSSEETRVFELNYQTEILFYLHGMFGFSCFFLGNSVSESHRLIREGSEHISPPNNSTRLACDIKLHLGDSNSGPLLTCQVKDPKWGCHAIGPCTSCRFFLLLLYYNCLFCQSIVFLWRYISSIKIPSELILDETEARVLWYLYLHVGETCMCGLDKDQ